MACTRTVRVRLAVVGVDAGSSPTRSTSSTTSHAPLATMADHRRGGRASSVPPSGTVDARVGAYHRAALAAAAVEVASVRVSRTLSATATASATESASVSSTSAPAAGHGDAGPVAGGAVATAPDAPAGTPPP